MQIAIDGPSASGKSTIAKLLAKELNFIYIDTGAMYRAITYFGLKNRYSPEEVLKEKLDVRLSQDRVFINEIDVSDFIRTPEIDQNVSRFAKHEGIRRYLTEIQQSIAKDNDVVMDGRDIGTVVLRDAKHKFFITASPEVRAKRRHNDQPDTSLEQILEDLIKRDEIDVNREIAPLKMADDAILVDTSDLSIQETLDFIIKKIK